jgi:hypothetical protein
LNSYRKLVFEELSIGIDFTLEPRIKGRVRSGYCCASAFASSPFAIGTHAAAEHMDIGSYLIPPLFQWFGPGVPNLTGVLQGAISTSR